MRNLNWNCCLDLNREEREKPKLNIWNGRGRGGFGGEGSNAVGRKPWKMIRQTGKTRNTNIMKKDFELRNDLL